MAELTERARTRIYTRTGDEGMTGCVGGERCSKDDPRIEACGSLDEVNALLGATISLLPLAHALHKPLEQLQHDLFTVCAEIAALTEIGEKMTLPRVNESHTSEMERLIDFFDNQMPPQHSFLLPGGTQAASFLHIARTVARRAERSIVRLSRDRHINTELLRYVNRLSDLLYVMARFANQEADVAEQPPIYKKE